MSEDLRICVLCGDEITIDANGWGGGHNAAPLAKGRCCDECNIQVIGYRLWRLGLVRVHELSYYWGGENES